MGVDKEWWECDPDDNPFGLSEHQMDRVEGYLRGQTENPSRAVGKFREKILKIKRKRKMATPLLGFSHFRKECHGHYDESHNFCINICGSRKLCESSSRR